MARRGLVIGGFMGTGKTSIGTAVARRLGLPFVDLDQQVEAQAGRSVARIFAEEGEAGFRAREAAVVRSLVEGEDRVIALGGGTLHHGDNARQLAERFPVIVLELAWPEIAARLAGDVTRPLAADARALWEQRRPGYRAVGIPVDVTGLSVDAACDRVLEVLR